MVATAPAADSASSNSAAAMYEASVAEAAIAAAAEAKLAGERQQQVQRDQGTANKAVQTYARTPPSSTDDVSAKTAAETANFTLMMDYYMAQQGVYYSPGSSEYRDEEAALLKDPRALGSLEDQVAQGESGSGLSHTDLVGLSRGGEVAAGEQLLLPASQQTGQAIKSYDQAVSKGGQAPASVTTALQQAGFDEEVMVYERDRGLGLATPGSAQWKKDAESFLGSSQRLSVRDTVIATYAGQLGANGLDLPHFDAQLWAGETVEQAQLDQQQGQTAKAVATIANAFADPNDAGSAASFDDGLDPILARQALGANTYVTDLPSLIARTMRGLSPSDGIQLLSQVVSGAHADPQLATEIVAASAATLRTDLGALSSAGSDQAAQAFVSTAAIYYALQQAAQSGAPGASQLVTELAKWSFDAVNATNSTMGVSRAGTSPSRLDQVLGNVLTKAYQQRVAPNLFYQWTKLARGLPSDAPRHDNTTSWSNFRATLEGNPPQVSAFSSLASPFQQALPNGAKLAPQTVTAIGPGASASAPTAQALTQEIAAKIDAGETLAEAINATRAQMGAEDRNGTGSAAEQTLAEAALALVGQNNLPAYYKNPTTANDPITLASSQLAKLNVFDPAVLTAATKKMTATEKPDLKAVQTDAGQVGTAYKQWQADLAAHKPAAVTGKAEQAYLDALMAELDDASGETGQAWLNDPTQVDRLWKAEYLVETTNLAPQIRSGNQQAMQTAYGQLQTSFETLSILADVSAAGGADKQAQELTADLSGLSPTDPLYQEVMQSGSVQALQAQAQAQILAPAQPPPNNACVGTGQPSTPESRLANEAKVLAEYQGTVLYGGKNGLLATTIAAPVTQQLFGAVADGALPHGASPGTVLDNVANVLHGLQADPDLAAALYQEKFAGKASSAVNQYSSQDDPQKYYTDLGEIYVDIGGGQSAQGTALRKAVEARLGGADPVETHPQQRTGRAAALDPQNALPSYELDGVKSSGAPMQLYQDILDDAPNTSWAREIAGETGYAAGGAAPKPINAPNTDPVGLAGVNGLTPVTTMDDLINQLGSEEGLTPTHLPQNAADQTALSRGDFAEYNLNQTVYGGTTLDSVLKSVMSSAGVTDVSAQDPVVIADLPLNFQSQDGRSQSLALLEVDGGAGQSAYVGPADVTARSSFGNWIEYNGFPKGTLFVQPNRITNGPSVQGNAYWITNQTGITTWDKVKTDAEIGLTVTAGLLATFVQPESAPLWLALLAEGADVYLTANAAYGAAQAVGSLTTNDGYDHWQNWLDLGANVFGAMAGAGSIATRSATLVGRLGVASEDFASAANLTTAGEDAAAGANGAQRAGAPRQLTPYGKTLPTPLLNSSNLAATVRGINTAEKTLGYKAVGFLALGTNIGSLGNQGYQMFVEHQGETGQNVLQFAESAGLMGAGFFVARGRESGEPQTDVARPDAENPSERPGSPVQTLGLTVPPGSWHIDPDLGVRRWTPDAPSATRASDSGLAGGHPALPSGLAAPPGFSYDSVRGLLVPRRGDGSGGGQPPVPPEGAAATPGGLSPPPDRSGLIRNVAVGTGITALAVQGGWQWFVPHLPGYVDDVSDWDFALRGPPLMTQSGATIAKRTLSPPVSAAVSGASALFFLSDTVANAWRVQNYATGHPAFWWLDAISTGAFGAGQAVMGVRAAISFVKKMTYPAITVKVGPGDTLDNIASNHGISDPPIPPEVITAYRATGTVDINPTESYLAVGMTLPDLAQNTNIPLEVWTGLNPDLAGRTYPKVVNVPKFDTVDDNTEKSWKQVAAGTPYSLAQIFESNTWEFNSALGKKPAGFSPTPLRLKIPARTDTMGTVIRPETYADLQPGQSLKSFARDRGVSVREVIRANQNEVPTSYRIPANGAVWAGDTFELPRPFKNNGETWGNISRKTARPVDLLIKFNKDIGIINGDVTEGDKAPALIYLPKYSWEQQSPAARMMQIMGSFSLSIGSGTLFPLDAFTKGVLPRFALSPEDVVISLATATTGTLTYLRGKAGSLHGWRASVASKAPRWTPRSQFASAFNLMAKGIIHLVTGQ